jgi:UDP-glucose 4-epimerase
MDRILVTGCAGFIGSSLTDRLLAAGHSVVGIDSFEDYYARADKERNLVGALDDERFTLVEQDLVEADLARLVDGVSCVYHLAAQAGVRASWGSSFDVYARNNVLATQRLLEASRAAGVPKLVYASSSSVYGDQDELPLREDMTPRPRSPYGVTKLAGEHLCLLYQANYGLDTVALRFFTVYGPRQRPDMAFNRFIRAIVADEEIAVYGDGSQTRDFTFIDDIVDGLVRAPRAPAGAVMNLGGGNRVTLMDTLSTLGEILGRTPRLRFQPVEAGDVRDTWADVTAAETLIDYRPTTGLADGLARECEWMARGA